MKKFCVWALVLVALVAFTGLVSANKLPDGMTFDADAAKQMSPEERQAYKDRLEATARANGWTPQKRAFQAIDRQAPEPGNDLASGTITYHSGTLGTCCQNSFTVGNLFDTALTTGGTMNGPVEMSGSVTMVAFDMIAVAPANVFISFFHNVSGTMAPRIGASILTSATTGANTKTVTIAYSGTSFIAGVWQFTPDSPAVATGTANGQGFHGVSLNDGATGTLLTNLGTLNAAFSATGNVLTPVELMSFEIE